MPVLTVNLIQLNYYVNVFFNLFEAFFHGF